jgi:cytochrome c-type biogenesis protein
MIEYLFDTLSNLLYQNFWLTIFSSFVWGILSILLSPCHLTSIPLIIGFINSQGEITIKRTFSLSLVFAIGILITIGIIGGITLALGRMMGDLGSIGNYIIAIVFFIMGLYLLDIIRLPWEAASLKPIKFSGLISALIMGLLFGIGLGPCTFAFMAPILGVVFEVSHSSIFYAIILLTAFSIGHCSVIASAGTLAKAVQKYLNWTEKSKVTKYLKKACGVLVILGGVYLLFR